VGYETAGDPRRRATTFAEQLASRCANALGDRVVAVILHGSLTLGDFTPGRSDIDLLIVVEQPLADEEIGALQEAVDPLRGEAPSRVDLRVVTRAVAAAPAPAPAMEASIALRPGQPLAVETRVAGEPDLVVEFSLVRGHGRSIVGADPSTVIGAVPDEWVVEVGDRQLAAWERLADDAAHAELMVLTTCRIWRFSAEGVHCSKSEAGHWALARDPSLTVVEEALRQRGGDPEATIGEEGIRCLIALVRREIAHR
jgi:predicted nucleotidyltransferase